MSCPVLPPRVNRGIVPHFQCLLLMSPLPGTGSAGRSSARAPGTAAAGLPRTDPCRRLRPFSAAGGRSPPLSAVRLRSCRDGRRTRFPADSPVPLRCIGDCIPAKRNRACRSRRPRYHISLNARGRRKVNRRLQRTAANCPGRGLIPEPRSGGAGAGPALPVASDRRSSGGRREGTARLASATG